MVKMKTKSPIKIPEANCPEFPDGMSFDFLTPGSVRDYVNRIEVKAGGSAFTSIADFSFDIFEGSTRIYSAASESNSLKIELADWSLLPTVVSIQDRPTPQPWDDRLEGSAMMLFNALTPGKELWRELMTPNAPLNW